jgi:hypothetical protein
MAAPAKTFTSVYAQVAQDLQRKLGDDLAAQAGPPASMPITPITDAKRVEIWNQRHPEATEQACKQLAAQKYAEHRARGLPEEQAIKATAEDVTHFMYRGRQQLYTLGTTTWTEQVAEAKRLARAAAKSDTPAAPAVAAGEVPVEQASLPSPELSAPGLGGVQSSGPGATAPPEAIAPGASPASLAAPAPPGGLNGGY